MVERTGRNAGIRSAIARTARQVISKFGRRRACTGADVKVLTAEAWRALSRRHKYGAKRVVVDGVKFASIKEARRYQELRLRERAREIRDLKLQPEFPLFTIRLSDHTPVPILTETGRIYKYQGDFAYTTKDGKYHVEDVKSKATLLEMSKLKMAILEASTGLKVEIVL